MIKFSQKNSEHDDLYKKFKLDDKEQGDDEEIIVGKGKSNPKISQDPYLNLKQNYSLKKDYEIYLETEKKQQLFKKMWKQDPMDRVADKIRKNQDLDNKDLRVWCAYNFLAFPQADQDTLKSYMERQQWFFRRMSVLIPPIFYGIYAVIRYQYNIKVFPTMILSSIGCYSLFKIGLMSSNREINQYNRKLYEQYKDEVTNPKYRGLKLYKNKKAYQIDNKEYTTSNFDELKRMINTQLK